MLSLSFAPIWLVCCGSLTSGQLLRRALSRLPQGKAFHLFVPFCRLLRTVGNTGGLFFPRARSPSPGPWVFLQESKVGVAISFSSSSCRSVVSKYSSPQSFPGGIWGYNILAARWNHSQVGYTQGRPALRPPLQISLFLVDCPRDPNFGDFVPCFLSFQHFLYHF